MENKLKKAFVKKTEIPPSEDFDKIFFQKLNKSQKASGFFPNWLVWAVSGCATASVLFIAITNYNVPVHSFNHKEYVESALEIQSTITEDITSDDMIDLTSSSLDEI